MATTRILVSDPDGAIVSQLLDSSELQNVVNGTWRPSALHSALDWSRCRATLETRRNSIAAGQRAIGALDEALTLTVRRVLATDGAVPRTIRVHSPHGSPTT
jgi:hypothetical protein